MELKNLYSLLGGLLLSKESSSIDRKHVSETAQEGLCV